MALRRNLLYTLVVQRHHPLFLAVCFVAAISSDATATRYISFSFDRLLRESNLVMVARIDDYSVETTTSNAMGDRVYQVFHYSAKARPIRIFYEGPSAVREPLVVRVQDSDYHGAPLPPFEKGRDYILMLKAEGLEFRPVHRWQSIMATNPQFTDARGPLETSAAFRFIELYFSTSTTQADWRKLAESLTTNDPMNSESRTGTILWTLASMPIPNAEEEYALKVMTSTHSHIARVGMHRLIGLGSERGLDAIMDRYFRLKSSMDLHTPEGYSLVSEYNILLVTAPAKLKPAILRYKARYPEETELFKEIR